MNTKALIQELIEFTHQNTKDVQSFKDLSDDVLNFKSNANSWSILECIEHLNRYGDFYIPEIKKKLESSTHRPSETFKTGLLGNYFAKSLMPKERLNKMKTFKSMNPSNSQLDRSALDKFLHQQVAMLDLLNQSRSTNLTQVKTSISISNWIKLRLGDTFRVVIYHNLRHVLQAQNMVAFKADPSQIPA